MTVWVIEHRNPPGMLKLAEDFAVAFYSKDAAERAILRDHGSYGPAFYRVAERVLAASSKEGRGTSDG